MNISKDIINRKGARKRDEVPSDVLLLLNSGHIESANLTEWLAIDHNELLKHVLRQTNLTKYSSPIAKALAEVKKPGTMSNYQTIGKTIGRVANDEGRLSEVVNSLGSHISDTARGYACYALADHADSLEGLLKKIEPYAADHHFGVRELAWLSTRPRLSTDLFSSISLLSSWTSSKNENVRRFAAEALRPNGVWCKHIGELKSNPEQGLPILEPLRSDSSKYVRDSVANWLNDASKSQPDFVRSLCSTWENNSKTKETAYIIKRALRTIDKKLK